MFSASFQAAITMTTLSMILIVSDCEKKKQVFPTPGDYLDENDHVVEDAIYAIVSFSILFKNKFSFSFRHAGYKKRETGTQKILIKITINNISDVSSISPKYL